MGWKSRTEGGDTDMDPVTLTIVSALANLSQNLIKDAYAAFKLALQKKYGVESDLAQAVNKLEQKPESNARQAVLQDEVTSSGAGQDQELLSLANQLLEQIKQLPGSQITIKQDIAIRGNRNIVTGQGNVSVNE
jgi:hypothetical protein